MKEPQKPREISKQCANYPCSRVYSSLPTNAVWSWDGYDGFTGWTWPCSCGSHLFWRLFLLPQALPPSEAMEQAISENPSSFDPSPWCGDCGAKRESQCGCGPTSEND